ncbi:hypothetical protein QFZ70_000103 [Arthrobacter sp. V1I9]|jgi:hypothetical protein|nr:hypothetical protein [Arthrobacter sp. V1I9]
MPIPPRQYRTNPPARPSRPAWTRYWSAGWGRPRRLAGAPLPQFHVQSPEADGQPMNVLRAFYSALATF